MKRTLVLITVLVGLAGCAGTSFNTYGAEAQPVRGADAAHVGFAKYGQ